MLLKFLMDGLQMKIRNTFYDSVGGIASGEGLVHVEMLQRKDFNAEKKPEFEVSERLTMTITTFLRMHQSMGRVIAQLEEKGVIRKRDGQQEVAPEQATKN